MSYQEIIANDGRLIILRELDAQIDGKLNETSLRRVLEAHGINRSRDWLVTQLNRLAEIEAVKLLAAGEIVVAAITPLGRDHVGKRTVLSGVTRPHELGG